MQRDTLQILHRDIVAISKNELQEDIKLSRFVRDLHYGRGIFDGDISLLINDYGAIVLTLLALSGYIIWWLIRQKRYAKFSRRLIRWHANIFSIVAIFPLVILTVTGIFLDHSKGLAKFMASVNIPHAVLPSIYDTLQSDIWSVDYDGRRYRIGNRYGVYGSDDLKNWKLENRGFAYRMIRRSELLYISGMGAHNRVLKDGNYKLLSNTPHMFRDVIDKDAKVTFFATMDNTEPLPKFQNATLYTLLLALHDGTFFSSWWIWINDFGTVGFLILSVTGLLRWLMKKKFI
jgi:hypothetical protein